MAVRWLGAIEHAESRLAHPSMKLWPIARNGTVDTPLVLPGAAEPVLAMVTTLYRTVEYRKPWIAYLASEGDRVVGTCAFKSAPDDGRVEIAYFTFPEHEGQGVATRMVAGLLDLARAESPRLIVAAQTLPQESASTRILRKHGFEFHGSVQHPEDGLVWEWRRAASANET